MTYHKSQSLHRILDVIKITSFGWLDSICKVLITSLQFTRMITILFTDHRRHGQSGHCHPVRHIGWSAITGRSCHPAVTAVHGHASNALHRETQVKVPPHLLTISSEMTCLLFEVRVTGRSAENCLRWHKQTRLSRYSPHYSSNELTRNWLMFRWYSTITPRR